MNKKSISFILLLTLISLMIVGCQREEIQSQSENLSLSTGKIRKHYWKKGQLTVSGGQSSCRAEYNEAGLTDSFGLIFRKLLTLQRM